MKKIIISTLAAMSLAACVQEQVVDLTTSRAITFENAFIDNATRAAADPSTTTEKLDGFNVWAFMEVPTGTVFTGDQVKRNGDAWTYEETQYWAPGHKYYFAAISPMDSENWSLNTTGANTYGPGEISFTNFDGSEDLIYASTMVETPELDDLVNGMPAVQLQFSHLLSKVKFTFINGFQTSNSSVEIKDIKMTAPKNGTIDLAVENWWDNDDWQVDGAFALQFGDVARLTALAKDECSQERLTIPVGKDYEYAITFDMILYTGDLPALELTKTSTVSGVALEMGKAYNFTAEINPENLHLPSIEFDVVEVKDWDYTGSQPIPGYQPDMKITTAFDFEAALAAKWPRITLGADVVLTSGETNVIGDLVLDLNGYSIISYRDFPPVAPDTAPRRSTLYVDGVKMTIIGEGTIANDGHESAYAVTVGGGGRVTVEGNINTRSYHDPFYVHTGELYIMNGFHVAVSDTDPYVNPNSPYDNSHPSTVINCNDNAWSDVYLTGGTYVNMDPSDVREWKINHVSFVVEGYKVVAEPQENGDIWYTVVAE